jgi:hypothetical protein
MKKFSNYYKTMMCVALFFGGFAIEAGLESMPNICAVLCTISFVSWYAGVMAPDNEKYKA